VSERATRVLLIDDDEDQAVLVRAMLRETASAYRFEWRSSAREGVDALRLGDFDVCLLDQHLGDGTGLEVLAAAAAGCKVPIVMLTGTANREVDARAQALGADDFLEKDRIDAPGLDRVIRYACERAANRLALEQTTQELTSSDNDLQQFAQTVAHDLRGPLHSIALAAELLDLHVAQGAAEGRELLELLRAATERMEQLLSDLLEYARAGSERQPPGEVALEAVLDCIEVDLRAELLAGSADLRRGPLPIVRGDATLLRQLLQNLVANAVKFRREEPPRIDISAARGPVVASDRARQRPWHRRRRPTAGVRNVPSRHRGKELARHRARLDIVS
jgi:signal transduction histidine kinase